MTRMLKLVRASCSYALSMADIASMWSYSSSDALKGSPIAANHKIEVPGLGRHSGVSKYGGKFCGLRVP